MKKGSIGYFIIASAIIWAVVIVGCSMKLEGAGYYAVISPWLFGGVIAHILFIWGPLGAILKKSNVDRLEKESKE